MTFIFFCSSLMEMGGDGEEEGKCRSIRRRLERCIEMRGREGQMWSHGFR